MKAPLNYDESNLKENIESSKTLLVDADFIKYHVPYFCYNDYGLNDKGRVDLELLQETTDKVIAELTDIFLFKDYIYIFSGKKKNGYRDKIAQLREYKGKRRSREPLYASVFDDMDAVMYYIVTKYKTIYEPTLEADDVISYVYNKDKHVIYSKDKDLMQIPGYHYDIKKNDIIEVSEDDAYMMLIKQVMIGDSTDGIMGLHRYGIKKYEKDFKLMLTPEEAYKRAVEIYIERLGFFEGIDTFNENYALCRLLRKRGDYIKERYKWIDEKLQEYENDITDSKSN